MPKLLCPCGFVHDLSPIPDHGWVMVRDEDYDRLLAAERVVNEITCDLGLPSDSDPRVDEYDAATALASALTGSLYECPRCGTLLWCKPGSREFRAFKPLVQQGGARTENEE
jgi:hypothetical protein